MWQLRGHTIIRINGIIGYDVYALRHQRQLVLQGYVWGGFVMAECHRAGAIWESS